MLTSGRVAPFTYTPLSLLGIGYAGYLFLIALLQPESHIDFIFNLTGPILFLEFLSMHASGMAAGAKAGKLSVREISKSGEKYDRPIRTTPAVRLFLISGYAVFALALGYAFGSWIVPLYFFVSVLSKFFSQKATGEMFRAGLTALLFLCTIFFVFLIAPLIVRIFPFSQAVLSQHPDGTFTSPVDAPQVLLVWGVLYFLALGVTETVLLFKKPKM